MDKTSDEFDAVVLDHFPEALAVVSYGILHRLGNRVPYQAHMALRTRDSENEGAKIYVYQEANGIFTLPALDTYRASSSALAHTRTLSFLKPLLGGPFFDLEAAWEEHTALEFQARNVEQTMVWNDVR